MKSVPQLQQEVTDRIDTIYESHQNSKKFLSEECSENS